MRFSLLLFTLLLGAQAYGQKAYYRTLPVSEPCETVGVFDTDYQSNIQVFPNPAQSSFTLQTHASGLAILTDIKGAILQQQVVSNSTSLWDVSGLSAGLYFITVKTEESVFRTKILIKQ